MSNEMNNLFTAESNSTTSIGGRELSGTAQLTAIATSIATSILATLNDNIGEYLEDVKRSQKDNGAMDVLIANLYRLDSADTGFLLDLDDNEIEGMLKSQQSKRSRCKAKAMTMDNYKSLLVGAISENLIRITTGRDKSSGGSRRTAGSVVFSDEALEALKADQDRLKKEIRNVQSKKSIMKSKADFSEDDERWQQLLVAEKQLKDLRETNCVDTTRSAIVEILQDKDINSLKAADAKELLAAIQSLI